MNWDQNDQRAVWTGEKGYFSRDEQGVLPRGLADEACSRRCTMSIYKKLLFTLMAGLTTIVLVGCGQEKPAERAGEKADQTGEKGGEKIEEPVRR